MRERLDRRWIVGTAATMLVVTAAFFGLSLANASAASCDINRYISGGTVDVASYLQCESPSGAPNSVVPGGTVHFQGGGFASDSTVTIELHSISVVLTTTTANHVGNFSVDVVIPADATLGAHELVATGVDSAGNPMSNVLAITVVSPTAGTGSTSGTLPVTGTNVGPYVGLGLALILVGGAAVWGARRESSTVDA